MIFLSSIPRSGSTLLTSLLNQHPDVYASPTSNLCDIMGAQVNAWENNLTTHAQGGTESDLLRLLKTTMDNRYDTHKIVIDKGRGWGDPRIISTLLKLQDDVKIIATVRPVNECLASFVKLLKVPKSEIKAFCEHSELANHIFQSYSTLKAGYEAYPDKFLLVEYDNLASDPQKELNRIAKFCELECIKIKSNDVADSEERDEAWGIKDLHKVRSKVSKQNYNAKRLLGADVWKFYSGGEFWNDNPEPKRSTSPIQIQHKALMSGDFEKSKRLAYKNLSNYPSNPDICFNAGWAKLSDGVVDEGYALLDKGRTTTVWGDPFKSTKPLWNGECGTVLLRLERGLGDQIHQVRYARDLKAAGCTVVVSCQSPLAELLSTAEGVDVVVQHEAAAGVYHDYFLPAMSAPIQLGMAVNDDINGKPYIPTRDVETVPGRIGLRWQGFSGYEHQTQRKFPADLMFDAVQGNDCISLQRDEATEVRPRWVDEVPLGTWLDTADAISSCELVITSCTSVAHLAGALGVPVWNVIPMVPYYLWTYPGVDTPYYNSMQLFRQTKDEGWQGAFNAVSEALSNRKEDVKYA